jgi:RNA polymerase sigma-70 factor, ECF subfamily
MRRPTMSDDNFQLRAAVAGDSDAMSELLQRYGPQVERTLDISREWRSVLEPTDVMQVTYLEAFMQIARYDPDRSEPFRAWLQRIAENNLRDAIRGLQRQKRPQPSQRVMPSPDAPSQLLEQLGATSTTPSRHATHDERVSMLEAALDALPDDYARVVRLYDLRSVPMAQITQEMKRSAGAIHMLRARAHDRLRQLLGAESQWFGSSA